MSFVGEHGIGVEWGGIRFRQASRPSFRPQMGRAKMRKAIVVASAVLFSILGGSLVALAHGGSHHAQPGYERGHDCRLGNDFHNYNHQNHYGIDKNIWCDGTNSQLRQHHTGSTVKAALAGNGSFNGGFCVRSELVGKGVLTVEYKNMVQHDQVWLQSGDLSYYPIDRAQEDITIQIEDNGWADRNPALGIVEAEVLFSGSGDTAPGSSSDGGGGGCNAADRGWGLGMASLLLLPPFFLRGRKTGIGDA